ncbi:hypothetical protein BFF78_36405 [Streptomyces fodineus]|uniref:Uncharacterized protein n=1 Tax=Streptomyces fodineus TaxID=1904616 RepID=A0A1D7YJQ2_9ACTN|nr:hypothetical protein BFF78_36405 [Streptomyces fodineus]
MHGAVRTPDWALGPCCCQFLMKSLQPLPVGAGQGTCCLQALADADEGVQVPEFEGGSGQSVEAPKKVRNVGVAAVLVGREFLPEGHWPTVSLDRLIDVDQADGRHRVLGEPTSHPHFTDGRRQLARPGDSDDHALAWKAPYLVFREADRLGDTRVEACPRAGFV